MPKKVTFEQLRKILTDFGFSGEQHGRHVIFRHAGTGAILTVPRMEGPIRPIYVSSAARQIANSGIATMSAFEARLAQATRDAA